jgi:hypothetical protein
LSLPQKVQNSLENCVAVAVAALMCRSSDGYGSAITSALASAIVAAKLS